jgi:hypothetical protein
MDVAKQLTFTGAAAATEGLLPEAASKPEAQPAGAARYLSATETTGGRRTRRRKHAAKNKSKKASRNPKKISKRHLTRSTFRTRHRL